MIAIKERPSHSQTSRWFESWFDSIHYHRLYGYRDDAEAARFVDAAVTRLAPAPHASALDLGCGAGRHSRQLAARGLHVTGLDLSAASIAMAKTSGSGVRFIRQDMREPFGLQRFDLVFNLFTSFGYFDDVADDERVVRNIARSLRPSGRLLLDYLNVRHAERQLVPREDRRIGGVRYQISRWSDSGYFYKRIEIVDRNGESLEHFERVAKFTLGDFCRMLFRHGLALEAVYGDYSFGPYDSTTSPRMILVARKGTRATRRRSRVQVPGFCAERLFLPREILADSAERLG